MGKLLAVGKFRWAGLAAIGLLINGCDANEAGVLDDHGLDNIDNIDKSEQISPRSVYGNDVLLNSAELNGWSLNGFRMNGWSLNGWSLNGWSLNGWSLNDVALSGSRFTALKIVDGQAVTLTGEQLIGAELTLANDGVPFTLRFDDIYRDPARPTGDVYFHKVSVYDADSDTWSSLCRDSFGAPTEAIALTNYWDPVTGDRVDDSAAVTLACRGAALAKCVEWGYRPWATATRCTGPQCATISLADHHQACTRMARADYCGNGIPNTLNNTPIDVYDRLSPKIQSQDSVGDNDWKVEAEWGPNGALCMGKETRLKMFAQQGIAHADPTCRKALEAVKECGKFPASRASTTKLANNYCPKWKTEPNKCALFNDNDDDDDDDDDEEDDD